MKKMNGNKIHEQIPLSFRYNQTNYKGYAKPMASGYINGICNEFDIILNGQPLGTATRQLDKSWELKGNTDTDLIKSIGEQIDRWYQQE